MVKLRERFAAAKVKEKSCRYIGFKVQQYSNEVILDNSDYIVNIKNPVLEARRASEITTLLNKSEQTTYRQLTGLKLRGTWL